MTKSMPEQRELYASRFTCAKGNWDLYIPFWEKGFNLLNPTGVMSLITPNKWLAIKYGAALRKFLFPYLFNISDYSDFYAFESADVSTVVAMASKTVCDNICAIKFDGDYSIKSKNEVKKKTIEPFDNISLCLSDNFEVLQKMLDNETLGDLFNISGAATVSETYEIAKYLYDNKSKDVDNSKYLKFVNTGTIDKFTTAWGHNEMTYVKQKYLYPVIDKNGLKKAFPRRYQQGITPKLITTGIRYFEVFGDFEGKYMAAKSTEIITAKASMDIKTVLPILNSNVVFFFLKEAYGGMAMGGGITFSPDNLSKIPIPKIDETAQVRLYQLAEKYAVGFDEESQDELDEYVCKLYGFGEKEKNIINSFKLKTRRKR